MDIYFSVSGGEMRLKCPYVQNLFELDIEKGFLEFNGHFRAEDDELPFVASMVVRKTARYSVEIYRREILESTNEYTDEIDGMRVCHTPSNRIRIWFRVLG